MVNKKLLISFLLILLVAVSASAVSAADDADAVAADDSAVLAAQTIVVEGDDDVAINAAIANATTGSTIDLGKDKSYNINGNITVKNTENGVTVTPTGDFSPSKINAFIKSGKADYYTVTVSYDKESGEGKKRSKKSLRRLHAVYSKKRI